MVIFLLIIYVKVKREVRLSLFIMSIFFHCHYGKTLQQIDQVDLHFYCLRLFLLLFQLQFFIFKISFFFYIFLSQFRGVHEVYDNLSHRGLDIFIAIYEQQGLSFHFRLVRKQVLPFQLSFYILFKDLQLSFSLKNSSDF